MPLRRYRGSNSVFQVHLPCWDASIEAPASINLVLWNSNYYRYPSTDDAALEDSPTEFRQVYLRYQDPSNHTVTFDIDDSAIIENGFTCAHTIPKDTGSTFTLTNTNSCCVKIYSEERGDGRFEVDFGQCLGLDWVHLGVVRDPEPWIDDTLTLQVPGGALSMADAPSHVDSLGHLWVLHLRLPGSTWTVRIYRVAWERSKIRLRMEIFRRSHLQNGLDGWNAYDVEVSDFLIHVDYYHDHS